MKSGIYKITNPKGKIYIGQAVDLDDRKKDYKAYNCKSQRLIYNSLKKYGWENHNFSILIEGSFVISELNILEIYYIKKFNSFRGWTKNGLNLTTGGNSYNRDKSSKQLISNSLKKFHEEIGHSKETKSKISNSLKGTKQSKETIEKRDRSRSLTLQKIAPTKPTSKYNRDKKKKINSKIKEEKYKKELEMVEDLKSGLRQYEVANKYDVVPSVVTQLKKKYNIEIKSFIRAGENNNFSKLSEKEVIEIKKLLKDKVKHQLIADKYNVKVRTIKAIASGQNWSHIIVD